MEHPHPSREGGKLMQVHVQQSPKCLEIDIEKIGKFQDEHRPFNLDVYKCHQCGELWERIAGGE